MSTTDERLLRYLVDASDKVEHVYEGIRSRYKQNHYAALRAVLVAAQEHQLIHPRVLHQMLFNKTGMMQQGIEIEPGAYRQRGVYIQRSSDPDDIHRFPHWERLPALMLDWWRCVNSYMVLDLHRAASVFEFHAWFESIHPFIDGNGRVGRLVLWNMQAWIGHQLRLVSPDNVGEYYAELEDWRKESAKGKFLTEEVPT